MAKGAHKDHSSEGGTYLAYNVVECKEYVMVGGQERRQLHFHFFIEGRTFIMVDYSGSGF